MNLHFSDYVALRMDISELDTYCLLDSQADVSVIKEEHLNENTLIDESEIIEVRGVVKVPIRSLGFIMVKINIDDLIILHKFHVMPNNFNIPCHGIVGKDFIKFYEGILDYGTQSFTIRTKFGNRTIPMHLHTQEDEVVVPPRSEIYRLFKVKSQVFPVFIQAMEIKKGVLTANTIAHSEEVQICIVNTTESMQRFRMPKFKATNLRCYNVYKMKKTIPSDERTQKLLTKLQKSFPSDKNMRKMLSELCTEYSDIFAMDTDELTVNNFYEQELHVRDKEPVYSRKYRNAPTEKKEIDRQVKTLLENNLIEPSVSDYNSPVILVPKKSTGIEKKWRLCIDYRKLNKKLIADRHPLPRIDDILDNLGRAKYFSIIDLFSGFHQVPLKENSRNFTTFSTDAGSFRWRVLPFGLNVSPNSFSRMMAIAFSGLPPDRAFIYIDDIIVIGRTESNHIANLRSVFDVLRKYNLKINAEKCRFFQPEVTFLGHRCTSNGICPDDSKLHAIKNYPAPQNKDEVRSFLGTAGYYRKFIKDYAEIAAPLTYLTKKKTKFVWESEQRESFERLKNELLSPNVLQYPDPTKPYTITTDASNFACSGVLSQETNGHQLPVAFFSRTFQKGERNKPIIEKELLAIYNSILAFRHYIYGTQFTVFSDHKPLVYLFGMTNPASKLVRIRLELEEYKFEIIHIRGKDNVVADSLSRIHIEDLKNLTEIDSQILAITRSMSKRNETEPNDTPVNNESIKKVPIFEDLNGYDKQMPRLVSKLNGNSIEINAYKAHKKIFSTEIKNAFVNGKLKLQSVISGINDAAKQLKIEKLQLSTCDKLFELCTKNELINKAMAMDIETSINLITQPETVIDEKRKQEILQQFHDHPIFGGHVGFRKTYEKIRKDFYWKDMTRDITSYIKNCQSCRFSKLKPGNTEKMTITPTPIEPFHEIVIDTVGPLTKSSNNNLYILTMMCELTKYLIAVPMSDKTAEMVASVIFKHLILVYGPIKQIKSDRGTEFNNSVITELCKLMDMKKTISTAYHHQTLGTVERNHRNLNEYIRAYISENITDWEHYLEYFVFCYNTTNHSSFEEKYSPFELVFGRRAKLPTIFNSDKIDPVYNIDNYIKIIKYRMQKANQLARQILIKIKNRNKMAYDKKAKPLEVSVGERVLVAKEPYNKLKPIYDGPFVVEKVECPNLVLRNSETNKLDTVHMNRVRKFE